MSQMSPQIAGMLKAAAKLIEAAEAGDQRVTTDYVANAKTYAVTLLKRYRDDPNLAALLESAPVLMRLQTQAVHGQEEAVLH